MAEEQRNLVGTEEEKGLGTGLSGNASYDALRILEDKGFSRRDDVCIEVIEVGERI
jgi:hypothetical protein